MLYVYIERVKHEKVCLSHIGSEVLKGVGDCDWFDLCLRCSLPETLPLLTRHRISNYIIFCRYVYCLETNIMQHAIDNKRTKREHNFFVIWRSVC